MRQTEAARRRQRDRVRDDRGGWGSDIERQRDAQGPGG